VFISVVIVCSFQFWITIKQSTRARYSAKRTEAGFILKYKDPFFIWANPSGLKNWSSEEITSFRAKKVTLSLRCKQTSAYETMELDWVWIGVWVMEWIASCRALKRSRSSESNLTFAKIFRACQIFVIAVPSFWIFVGQHFDLLLCFGCFTVHVRFNCWGLGDILRHIPFNNWIGRLQILVGKCMKPLFRSIFECTK